MDFGALIRKFVFGDQSADVLPDVNYKQLNSAIDTTGFVTQAQKDANPYIEQSQVYTPQVPIAEKQAGPAYDPAAAAAAQKQALMNASLQAIQQNIDSLGTRKSNTLAGVDQKYEGIMKQYGDQEAQNAAKFESERGANEGTYSRNQSLALQSAATGRQGLMATLASIGAMGPTAMNLANRAVARGANTDIGEATRTFEGNATSLNDSFNKTKQDEANRRLEAEAARNADKQSAEYDYTEALQKAYADMAQTYAGGGNAGAAQDFTGRAGSLYSQLAANTKPTQAAYQSRDIGLDTSMLAQYLAGQRQNNIQVAGPSAGSAMNSPIYAINRRREELV